jgi:O-antigen chain-terminating methyltransferase
MRNSFYRAFEDKFRGTRTEIKRRLQVYIPLVTALSPVYPGAPVLDLGCGRGEWLELLRDQTLCAKGVDLDAGMLNACHDLGLNVENAEAVGYLSCQKPNSALAVTAFHLVEHIGFSSLQALAAEAFRVLKPGGLLIMETPNPENFVVATQGFYLDPSHDKPIPPDLLAFVAEYAGFEQIQILRLQEAQGIQNKFDLNLNDVLSGASPDYAVVAQKPAASDVQDMLKVEFERNHGVSTSTLAELYRQQGAERHQKIHEANLQAQTSLMNLAKHLSS